MSTFAEKIGLQKTLRYELNITKEEFKAQFTKKMDKGDLGYLFDVIDLFSFSGNEYKGSVTNTGFKIRKKRGLFSTNNNQVTATGSFTQQDKLYVDTVISGVNYSLYFFIFTLFAFGYIISSGGFSDLRNPFVFFIAPVICLFHYFSIRRGIKRLRQDMEEDFQLVSLN